MRSRVDASLLSFLTMRPHSWRPHKVGAAGGWHARAVSAWRYSSRVLHHGGAAIAPAATLCACWGAVGGGRRGRGARSCHRFRAPRGAAVRGHCTQNANSKWSKVDVVALRRRRLRARRRLACSSRWAVCTATSSSAAVRRLPQHRAPSTARMRRPPLLPPPNCLHGHLPVAAPEDDALLSADDHVQELLLALT